MQHSKIEWTEATWNPVTGCTKISYGCKHCYAERLSKRLQAMGMKKYQNGFQVTTHKDVLKTPLRWKQPKIVFVNSMSDLFHKSVPTDFIISVFDVMNHAQHHTFQVLTKRPSRIEKISKQLVWTSNIWMGTSIESKKWIDRLDALKRTDAQIKFLSLEPLLEPIPNLDLDGIDWVIVGGESGPRARTMKSEWVREIRDQCINKNVPFFFKQWGGVFKKKMGRTLDGRTWDQLPLNQKI